MVDLNDRSDPLQDNVTVIIRSVGERTTGLCLDLIREQVISENIYLIHEIPFSQAVRRTFEIGQENDLPWTLAVDADILLAANSIKKLISLAEKEDGLIFKFNGRFVDKLFLSARHAGVHLYPTKFCEIAIRNKPKEESIRPESQLFGDIHRFPIFCMHIGKKVCHFCSVCYIVPDEFLATVMD